MIKQVASRDSEYKHKIMRTPRSVDIDITSKCNLKCDYCYYFENQEVNYLDLPAEEWLHFFRELERCSVISVCLAGGEAFMRKDLPELLDGIVNNKMRFSILSNGTLINDEIAQFIAGTGRCDYVQVSVDGSNPEVHESCRGKGSFASAIKGIQILRRHKVPVTVRVTIHHGNIYDLENIARFLLDDLGLSGFSTNSAGVLGACHQNANKVLLTIQDRQIAMQSLLQLAAKYPGRISASAGPLAEARTWRLMEDSRRSKDPAFQNGGRLTACGCYFNKIAIRSDGIITPCNMLPHIELGRINQDSLQDIWQNSFLLNQLRQRCFISLTDFEFCANCSYVPYCTGNCPALSYNIIGQVNHPSPDACLRLFLSEGGAVP